MADKDKTLELFNRFLQDVADKTGITFNGIIFHPAKGYIEFVGIGDTSVQEYMTAIQIKSAALHFGVDESAFAENIMKKLEALEND